MKLRKSRREKTKKKRKIKSTSKSKEREGPGETKRGKRENHEEGSSGKLLRIEDRKIQTEKTVL